MVTKFPAISNPEVKYFLAADGKSFIILEALTIVLAPLTIELKILPVTPSAGATHDAIETTGATQSLTNLPIAELLIA